MRKHILLILLGGLAILAFMFFLWFWLLRAPAPTPTDTGTLGQGETRAPGTGTAGTGVNTQTPIGGTGGVATGGTGTNVQTPVNPTYGSPDEVTFTDTPISYTPYTPGGVWLDGSFTSTSSPFGALPGTGSPRRFTPTPINQITSVDIGGTGYFPNTPNGSAGGGGGNGIFGVGIAGAIACTPGLLSGIIGGLFPRGLPVQDVVVGGAAASDTQREFLNCMARTIARVAIQRITADVVDWINSGFEGKPAFVQNFRQFFKDSADQAAGDFISGSKLAFLCSPFQLQVKIAISKSYAQRSSGGDDNACTLTDVTNNIKGFMEGNFSDGGWPAFLEFTTVPTNNPFGAFMTVQAQLGNEIASREIDKRFELSLGQGFLSSIETYECGPRDPATGKYNPPCKERVTTPGSAIASALFQTENLSQNSLLLADSFDEIIGALITQLMTRTLYGGLSNLSGADGYASNFVSAQDEQAQAAAEELLSNLQGAVQYAQQYGSAKQGSISDVQNAQNLLQSLANCWSVAASSTNITSTQQSQALANTNAANSSIQTLEGRVTAFNADITRANAAIAKVQQFQTSALAATTKNEVDAVTRDFTAARQSGTLMTQADVTGAQQDRAALQGEMSTLNQTTNSQVTQCYAFGQ